MAKCLRCNNEANEGNFYCQRCLDRFQIKVKKTPAVPLVADKTVTMSIIRKILKAEQRSIIRLVDANSAYGLELDRRLKAIDSLLSTVDAELGFDSKSDSKT